MSVSQAIVNSLIANQRTCSFLSRSFKYYIGFLQQKASLRKESRYRILALYALQKLRVISLPCVKGAEHTEPLLFMQWSRRCRTAADYTKETEFSESSGVCFIFRCRRSLKALLPTGRLRRSPPKTCWASRNRPPCRFDRDNIFRKARGKAAIPW